MDIRLTLAMEQDFMANLFGKLPYAARGIKMVLQAMKPQYREEIRSIAVPVLILWGAQDELFPQGDARFLHEAIKGSRMEIVPGNHDWCLFRPDLLSDFIARFVYSENDIIG